MADIPSLKSDLRDLILQALQRKYTAESCRDSIQTGNHYQSVTLGEMRTTGFRTDRKEFLDQIDFRGKKVLDLGSNLGEISRAARSRGASLVDGFEYDSYFLEIAQAINAHNGVTRVSFYQRDITDPSIYNEQYDLVLAFSVFSYIHSVLEQIAAITNEALVFETHKIENNLESSYLKPITRYFPFWRILGESEWGTPHDPAEKRLVIVFAKQESILSAILHGPASENPSTAPRLSTSEPAPIPVAINTGAQDDQGAMQPSIRDVVLPQWIAGSESNDQRLDARLMPIQIDLNRTSVHSKFFSIFEFDSVDDLFSAISGMQIDLASFARSRDLRKYGYSGWTYWLLYVKGYLEYIGTGAIGRGNIYYDYLCSYYTKQGHDPTMAQQFADPLLTVARIARRFRDFEFFRMASDSVYAPEPVRLIVSEPPPDNGFLVYETKSSAPLKPRRIDGHHRLFAAKLCRVPSLRGEVVSEAADLERISGEIEHFGYDGRRLTIQGWCLSPDRSSQVVEVRVKGKTIGVVRTTERPDVKARFPHIPHALRSGFSIEVECQLGTDQPIRFDILPLHDWLPVGSLEVTYRPETSDRSQQAAQVVLSDDSTAEPDEVTGENPRPLVERIHGVIQRVLPPEATVIIVSKGDDALVQLDGRTAWHFPQSEEGWYAGFHPKDSSEAIADLDALRAKGGEFLIFPSTSFWWLEHYEGLCSHLKSSSQRVWADDACVIYQLSSSDSVGIPRP